MPHTLTNSYIEDSISLFRHYKHLVEGALSQISDEQLTTALDDEMNSIAITIKHMAGNMRSRWSDFLTTDGEKPDRDRDTEFVQPPSTRESILALWEHGWRYVFEALEPLTDADLTRTVMIRGEPHSVMQAINRQLAHYTYHCGQIIMLAKHFRGNQWRSLTVPRNKSAEFTARVLSKEASQR